MGRLASEVNDSLRDRLADLAPGYDWEREAHVAGTPVDVLGTGERTVAVELEWRRADPADNAAKLFRHLADGTLSGEVVVVQAFTSYYDLASGGVSTKRANAEFVGRVAADTLDGLTYHAVEVPLDPPKRGADRPSGLSAAVERTARAVVSRLDRSTHAD